MRAAKGAADDHREVLAMKYLLALIGDESRYADRTPEQGREGRRRRGESTRATTGAGALVAGEGRQPRATATTVKIQESGDQIVTDGPFAETREQLGGFYLLECADLDEAIEWAAKIPGVQSGTIEIRPELDYEARSAGQGLRAEASQV